MSISHGIYRFELAYAAIYIVAMRSCNFVLLMQRYSPYRFWL